MRNTPESEAVPHNVAARALGVPAGWLREEVESGRLPGLVAGGRVIVHLPTVEALLAERAKGGAGEGASDGS